jgi:hypothetical protein
MKTQKFNLKSLVFVALSVLALIACNKKEDNNLANTPQSYQLINGQCYNNLNQIVAQQLCMNNGNYRIINGQCYDSMNQIVAQQLCNNMGNYRIINGQCYDSMNQIVAQQLCQYNGNGGYYMSGGYCYSSTGQMMPNTSYCQNINNGGMMGQQCYGSYLYQSGYWSQMVWCNGANCRGYTLYEVNTNRSVTCQ